MRRGFIVVISTLLCILFLSPLTLVFPPSDISDNNISSVIPQITLNDSEARPGGGSSFRSSGGSSHSGRRSSSSFSSSSNASDGALVSFEVIYWILRIFFEIFIHLDSPVLVIILIILVIIFLYYYYHLNAENTRQIIHANPTKDNLIQKQNELENRLDALQQRDNAFSRVLFLDFVHALYHHYYNYRGTAALHHFTPYFAPTILSEADKPHYKNQKITEIVVGSLVIAEINEWTEKEGIKITIEANYTHTQEHKSHRHIVRESWFLTRHKGILSLPPAKMRSVSCPNCGAPAHFTDSGQCTYCHSVIQCGEHQWMLERRIILSDEHFEAELLGTYVEEEGTELPTIRQEQLIARQTAFSNAHHLASWEIFWQDFQLYIVNQFFLAIYNAWAAQNWQTARHLMTDRIYASNHFWIQHYQAQGFINHLDKISIQRVSLAKIEQDKYYEAITVRIHASCYDYVTDSKGKVVGGSKRKLRKFSEYWTFIRRTGKVQQESEFDLQTCPSCGAPLDKMSMAAECGYCGSKVSTGDFSWVLAIITQDEVYQN